MRDRDDFSDALEIFAVHGVPVHTVAVGGDRWFSAAAPPFAKLGQPVEEAGKAVAFRSRRNPRRLAAMSRATSGKAIVIGPGVWVEALLPALDRNAAGAAMTSQGVRRHGLGQWPAALALLLLAWEGRATARRGGRPPSRPHDPWAGKRTVAALAVVSVLVTGTACQDSSAGGGGGGGKAGGGSAGSGSGAGAGAGQAALSAAEREHLAGELKRIRQQSESSTSYRQSGATRPAPGTGGQSGKGGGGRKIWW